MWKVRERFKNDTIALPGVEFKASELKSEKIEALVKANPSLVIFFEEVSEPVKEVAIEDELIETEEVKKTRKKK